MPLESAARRAVSSSSGWAPIIRTRFTPSNRRSRRPVPTIPSDHGSSWEISPDASQGTGLKA